jgi:hypothetical protein
MSSVGLAKYLIDGKVNCPLSKKYRKEKKEFQIKAYFL